MEPQRAILFIEDDRARAEYLGGFVSAPYTAVYAASGEEAKAQCKKMQPALIFLSDGIRCDDPYDILEELQDDADLSAIPIVMVSDHRPDRIEEMQIFGAGAADVLAAPFSQKTYEALLKKFAHPTQDNLIDEDAAIAYCGAREIFLEVARTFVTIWPEDREKIARAAREPDLKDYTVRVHALKNAAKVVGALRLSDDAARLEKSGKAGDRDAVASLTPTLLALYDRCAEELKGIIV